MNFKDITKDTTQDTILDTLRYAKKCSIATVGLSVLCRTDARRAAQILLKAVPPLTKDLNQHQKLDLWHLHYERRI